MTQEADGLYFGPKYLKQIILSHSQFIENGQAKLGQHQPEVFPFHGVGKDGLHFLWPVCLECGCQVVPCCFVGGCGVIFKLYFSNQVGGKVVDKGIDLCGIIWENGVSETLLNPLQEVVGDLTWMTITIEEWYRFRHIVIGLQYGWGWYNGWG